MPPSVYVYMYMIFTDTDRTDGTQHIVHNNNNNNDRDSCSACKDDTIWCLYKALKRSHTWIVLNYDYANVHTRERA